MHDISARPPVRVNTGPLVCQGGGVPETSSPTPGEPASGPPRPPMPTPTRVAVVLLALLGVLLLASATLNWVGQEIILERFEDQGQDREAAARSLLLFTIAYAIIGVSALAAAVFIPRGQVWARQVGLLVTSLLIAMTLLSTVLTGGVAATSLLVLVSALAGFTSLLSRQTKEWVLGVPAG